MQFTVHLTRDMRKELKRLNLRGKKMIKKILTIITMLLITITATACSTSNVTPESTVEDILKAIKEQDLDKVDKYFNDIPLGDFIYQDPEGFKMYTKYMTWQINNSKEEKNVYSVSAKVTNVDMAQLLENNPPTVGEMMPNPKPSEVDKANKKTFDIEFKLIKKDNEYIVQSDEEFIMELLNIITGGGTNYLLEFNKQNGAS